MSVRSWTVFFLLGGACAGCGTTKWTDTTRTATEQLLISDAMDRAVSQIDLRSLAGKKVFLDNEPVKGATDQAYLSSLLRQHMLASGCVLREKKDEADYIVEVRAGAIGTDRHDVLYGVPTLNVPAVPFVYNTPSTIPEIPLIKKTDQRAVTKIALFAYNRTTGRPVWQSGIVPMESRVKDVWVFGAGPFQRGSIYEGTRFAGGDLQIAGHDVEIPHIPLITPGLQQGDGTESTSVAGEAYFVEPAEPSPDVAHRGDQKPAPPPASGGSGQDVSADMRFDTSFPQLWQ